MSDVENALLAGMFVSLASMLIFLIFLLTNDYKPIERRAIRMAILAGITAVAAVGGTVVAIYFFVSEVIGAFLGFPSIGLAGIAVWHAFKHTYRLMGGGMDSQGSPSQESKASS